MVGDVVRGVLKDLDGDGDGVVSLDDFLEWSRVHNLETLVDDYASAAWQHGQSASLGSGRARLLRLLRARLAALASSVLPGEGSAHWAPSHCCRCSSQPPQKSPNSPPSTTI